MMTDKPVRIPVINEDGQSDVWEPKNADWSVSYREMSLRHAMARSLNTVTAQVTELVGADKVVEIAHKAGIDSKLQAVPSIGLGPSDVSVLEMVRAYSTLMNEGKRVDPILVSRIVNQEGEVIANFKSESKQVINPENAWLMTHMLKGTIEESGGTSQALWEWDLFKNENEIGGKTGTSSDYVDAWYMGVTKDLVTGVWVGCDDRSIHFKNSQTGEASRTALPIFGKFMEEIYKKPELGCTFGKFPEAKVPITKSYKCAPVRYLETPTQDSTLNEELNIDGSEIENIEAIENTNEELNQNNTTNTNPETIRIYIP